MLRLLRNHFSIPAGVMIMVICCTFSSCKDNIREQLLKENMIRLEQQNELIQNQNQSLRSGLEQILHDPYSPDRLGYLKKYSDSFYQSMDLFLSKIKEAKKNDTAQVSQNLFKYYLSHQYAFHRLKKSIIDSSGQYKYNVNVNGFMNLNENNFKSKYLSSPDSLATQNQLLILETDVLINHHAFLSNIYTYTTPYMCTFNPYRAMAFTNKCIYKKGEKLEITAFFSNYVKDFEGYVTINGEKLFAKDGMFHYSRTITESKGDHSIRFEIVASKVHNNQEIYPAEVSYKVE